MTWGKFTFGGLALFFSIAVDAYPVLPYSVRTSGYSGWGSNVRGDANTVGMAGATVAIPSSISATESNPAGFGMETPSVAAQVISDTIHDTRYQKSGETYESNQLGLGVSPPPWGFGVTYYSPMTEAGHYVSPTTGKVMDMEVSVKELRFTVARSLFESHLSLGISLEYATAIRNLDGYSYGAHNADFMFGALYRFEGHLVLGISVMPQMTLQPSSDGPLQTELPGINQPIVTPTKVNFGAGWIPNRFFKAGVGLYFTAPTEGTALLADQSKRVGVTGTLEPRAGMSYVLAEFKNWKVEWAVGSYFEPSRVDDEVGRLHGTTGLDINPYFINLSIAADFTTGYRNNSLSVGIDLVRTLRAFQIIPKDPVPPYNGIFPYPHHVSSEGMPAGMTQGEKKGVTGPSVGDVSKIIQDIPGKLIDKVGLGKKEEPKKHQFKQHHKRRKLKLPPIPEGD